MAGSDLEHERLKSLIFESVARKDAFDALIAQTDAAVRRDPAGGLKALERDFRDASDAIQVLATAGHGENEVRFSFDRKGRISQGDATAISVFGLAPGAELMDLLGEGSRAALEDLLRGRRSQATLTLLTKPRLRPIPTFVQAGTDGGFSAFAVSIGWTSALVPLLQDGFGLTSAEIDVVELLFRGSQPTDIAAARARSVATVRTQIRSICRKTDTRGHIDIVHLVYGLIATTQFMRADQTTNARGNHMLRLPCGGVLDIEITGPEQGAPLLFLHGCLAGRRLPPDALAHLSGRRIIAPARPGHGQTPSDQDPSPKDVAANLVAMLDRFGIASIDVVSYDLGGPHALWLAGLAPDRVRSLTCLAPIPPLTRWSDIWLLPPETRVFATLSKANPAAARYLALLGGQRILRQGPSGFAKIVFANSVRDQELVAASADVQHLFWHGHAWHVERGPDGFLADTQIASRPWVMDLPPLRVAPFFITGEVDRNAPKAPVADLAARVGARTQTLSEAGHSLIHAHGAAWAQLVAEVVA